jgi:quinol monooxygenase YgiN
MSENIVLFAEFTATPGNEEAVAELLAGRTEQVRQEPGCVLFAPHRFADRPEHFFVYEAYRDEAAFEAHITAPYGAVFNAALAPLIVEDGSQLTWLRSLDERR